MQAPQMPPRQGGGLLSLLGIDGAPGHLGLQQLLQGLMNRGNPGRQTGQFTTTGQPNMDDPRLAPGGMPFSGNPYLMKKAPGGSFTTTGQPNMDDPRLAPGGMQFQGNPYLMKKAPGGSFMTTGQPNMDDPRLAPGGMMQQQPWQPGAFTGGKDNSRQMMLLRMMGGK